MRQKENPRFAAGGRDQGGGDHVDRHEHNRPSAFSGRDSSPVEHLLTRLEGVRRSPRGWTAKCPSHEDRHASLSLAEGRDGCALINCFAGCTAEDVTRALGLELKDLFPPRDDRHPYPRRDRRRRGMKPAVLPRSIAETLVESREFAEEWTIAKALAEHEPRQQHADVVASWDYLGKRVDIPTVVQLASVIRGVALLSHADARHVEDADIARAVHRLIDVIEGRAA